MGDDKTDAAKIDAICCHVQDIKDLWNKAKSGT